MKRWAIWGVMILIIASLSPLAAFAGDDKEKDPHKVTMKASAKFDEGDIKMSVEVKGAKKVSGSWKIDWDNKKLYEFKDKKEKSIDFTVPKSKLNKDKHKLEINFSGKIDSKKASGHKNLLVEKKSKSDEKKDTNQLMPTVNKTEKNTEDEQNSSDQETNNNDDSEQNSKDDQNGSDQETNTGDDSEQSSNSPDQETNNNGDSEQNSKDDQNGSDQETNTGDDSEQSSNSPDQETNNNGDSEQSSKDDQNRSDKNTSTNNELEQNSTDQSNEISADTETDTNTELNPSMNETVTNDNNNNNSNTTKTTNTTPVIGGPLPKTASAFPVGLFWGILTLTAGIGFIIWHARRTKV